MNRSLSTTPTTRAPQALAACKRHKLANNTLNSKITNHTTTNHHRHLPINNKHSRHDRNASSNTTTHHPVRVRPATQPSTPTAPTTSLLPTGSTAEPRRSEQQQSQTKQRTSSPQSLLQHPHLTAAPACPRPRRCRRHPTSHQVPTTSASLLRVAWPVLHTASQIATRERVESRP